MRCVRGVCVHACACVRACVYARARVCACVCVSGIYWVCVCVGACIARAARASVCVYACMCLCVCACVSLCARAFNATRVQCYRKRLRRSSARRRSLPLQPPHLRSTVTGVVDARPPLPRGRMGSARSYPAKLRDLQPTPACSGNPAG